MDPFVAGALAELHIPKGRRPLLALPVVGTGEGGMADSKGDIHGALFESLYAAAAKHEVDLVLVCWGGRRTPPRSGSGAGTSMKTEHDEPRGCGTSVRGARPSRCRAERGRLINVVEVTSVAAGRQCITCHCLHYGK